LTYILPVEGREDIRPPRSYLITVGAKNSRAFLIARFQPLDASRQLAMA
jgi:hypothetical protein